MAAKKFIDKKIAEAEYGFSLEDLMAETGLSNIAARNQLLRLRPMVRRISPKLGFYLIVQPEHRSAGSPPVEWWLDDFFRWLGNPYYIALQSAAEWHGSSPQAIQVTQVMSDVPRKEICVGGRRIRFFVKKSIKDTLVASRKEETRGELLVELAVSENLLACYEALVGKEIFPAKELDLVKAWMEALG